MSIKTRNPGANREIPLVAVTKYGYRVASDVTNAGWEAGIRSYAINPSLQELVVTETEAHGLEPELRARAVSINASSFFTSQLPEAPMNQDWRGLR